MKGNWANGSQMFYGGLGYTGSTGVTPTESSYMFQEIQILYIGQLVEKI
jgi:hypothetical protein